ncbi:PQQ-like beta-propeller repeat protein [Jidongwangia harbinensis]|uniref:PQQ-like beta-propeller repeat protein n=1 Tax=Jidongwangia harbinensis TaxID=2878561 RepID=UPI001CDA3513|nr:PQQ-like beta-propeller repeat protein [Jidongwangia harbinensis]MCA2213602.1 PQQ-like beta-propeller repeat protein [Jidongwangia harbinensis]
MAGAGGTPKGYAAILAVVALVLLATTGVFNPWPKVWSWVTTSGPIAEGASQWQINLGGSPASVALAGDAVIVEYRTRVESYGVGAGVKLWQSDADWASVAGSGGDAVVVTGKLLTKGYQVLDPRSGAVRRTDTAATAVWTYANAIVDLRCAKGDECEVTAWDPRGKDPLWTVGTGGIGFVLDAANPDLPDTRSLGSARVHDQAGGRPPMPELLGLPDQGRIRIVDTAAGRVVHTVAPGPNQRVSVTGGRVLTVTGEARDGTCYYEVTATDPPAGTPVWRREALNLRTADDGAACKQDRDPAGGDDVVLGVDPYGREEVVAAHDGRILWRGEKNQDVMAVNDGYVVVRSADQDTFTGRSFRRGGRTWRRPVNAGASAALTRHAAIVATVKPSRLTALSPGGGAVLTEARTDAKVFAVGADGMIVVAGRDMAYLPFR